MISTWPIETKTRSPTSSDSSRNLSSTGSKGWNQVYAADFVGTDQPRISDLRRGRLERFSLEQLVRFVTRVDGTVRIAVEWSTRREAFFGPA